MPHPSQVCFKYDKSISHMESNLSNEITKGKVKSRRPTIPGAVTWMKMLCIWAKHGVGWRDSSKTVRPGGSLLAVPQIGPHAKMR
ncbi:hypothetical protein DPMN_161222 [Dreissena polymorpha]|uniref:Uncharacterized protein n=1 Tax=Dreissena polymorpha TaxID=45954 RepID=A0A9D4ESQ9_DREPO|nr:hypothetical protein DPMN_161222 [Dreissena polymorpha]